ncbi:hypothetical protein V5799_000761 [Amblyomma americanum]|uniref:EGF-like domain-containing protein n=1 Tax=Amblyomma americanum TaxID=6943 RepID=A0AAQ4D247_AMBAM
MANDSPCADPSTGARRGWDRPAPPPPVCCCCCHRYTGAVVHTAGRPSWIRATGSAPRKNTAQSMAARRRAVFCCLLLSLAMALAAPGRSPMPGSVFIVNPTSGTPLSTSAPGEDCADPSLPRWRNLPKTHRLVLSAANVACTPDSEANRTQEEVPRTTLSLSIQSMDDIQLKLSEESLPNGGNATDPRLALQSLQGGYGQQPCRRDEALLLWEKPYHSPGLTISPEILTPGSHALSVHLWGSAWLLNVSVAGHECARADEPGGTEAPCSSGGGACVLEPGAVSYSCRCCPGLAGRFCEERDGCFHKPCLNQGFCVDIAEGLAGSLFQCLCPHGFRGRRCEELLGACELHPCPPGSRCVQSPDDATNRSCVAEEPTTVPPSGQQKQPEQKETQQHENKEAKQETTQQPEQSVQPEPVQPKQQPEQGQLQPQEQETQTQQQPVQKVNQEEATQTEQPRKKEQSEQREEAPKLQQQQQVTEASNQLQQSQNEQSDQEKKQPVVEQKKLEPQTGTSSVQQQNEPQTEPNQIAQGQQPAEEQRPEQLERQSAANNTTTTTTASSGGPPASTTESPRNNSGGSACGARPCVHGKCEDLPAGSGGFRCYCLPGYGGDLCEFEYDECDSGPCAHGAQCEDLVAGFRCHCGPGYAGRRCEIKVDLCRPNPCPPPAQCLDRGNNYSCLCRHDGPGCTQRYDPCFPNPCQNGGSCWPSLDNFYCSCARGFTGETCEGSMASSSGNGGGAPLPSAPADAMARTQGRPADQLHNIYIAAATLAGACLIVLAVVSVCHCRVHQSYRGCVRRLGRSCAQLKQRTLPRQILAEPGWQRF